MTRPTCLGDYLGAVLILGVILLGAAHACRCVPLPEPVPVPVVDAGGDVVDAGPVLPDANVEDPAAECQAASDTLARLQCRSAGGDPLWVGPDGTPFATVCLDDLSRGVNWHPTCLKTISDCSQVDSAAAGLWCAGRDQ